jgi:hypothetical protein
MILLSDRLQSAMERYIHPDYPPGAREEARAIATALYNLLGEWRKHEGSKKDVSKARQGLREFWTTLPRGSAASV